MAQPFLGTIAQFGFTFAPRGYSDCNGQLISIAQNSALFALLGTTYGGDGQTTFGLPDLRGRVAIHTGQGPGLSSYVLGQAGGTENQTLTTNQMPVHTHAATSSGANASTTKATLSTPAAGVVLGRSVDTNSTTAALPVIYCPSGTATPVALGGGGTVTIANAGVVTPQPFSVIQPYLTIRFCIALEGIFPSRN